MLLRLVDDSDLLELTDGFCKMERRLKSLVVVGVVLVALVDMHEHGGFVETSPDRGPGHLMRTLVKRSANNQAISEEDYLEDSPILSPVEANWCQGTNCVEEAFCCKCPGEPTVCI